MNSSFYNLHKLCAGITQMRFVAFQILQQSRCLLTDNWVGTRVSLLKSSFYACVHKWCSGVGPMTFIIFQQVSQFWMSIILNKTSLMYDFVGFRFFLSSIWIIRDLYFPDMIFNLFFNSLANGKHWDMVKINCFF